MTRPLMWMCSSTQCWWRGGWPRLTVCTHDHISVLYSSETFTQSYLEVLEFKGLCVVTLWYTHLCLVAPTLSAWTFFVATEDLSPLIFLSFVSSLFLPSPLFSSPPLTSPSSRPLPSPLRPLPPLPPVPSLLLSAPYLPFLPSPPPFSSPPLTSPSSPPLPSPLRPLPPLPPPLLPSPLRPSPPLPSPPLPSSLRPLPPLPAGNALSPDVDSTKALSPTSPGLEDWDPLKKHFLAQSNDYERCLAAQTEKEVELCRHFNSKRGCSRGSRCKFLHAPIGPYSEAKSLESASPNMRLYQVLPSPHTWVAVEVITVVTPYSFYVHFPIGATSLLEQQTAPSE